MDATYSYDANGQRVGSVVTSGSVVTTLSWAYEGLQLLSLSASSSTAASYTIEYVHDDAGRPYAGFYRDGATSVAFGMVTTDRGDVIALANDVGNVFAQYAYDPWGNPLSSSSAATGSITSQLARDISTRQVLRYAGYCLDGESGLYYLSQRYYDPSSFQFLSKDPAKADGEESAYQYCGGDPVGAVDPTGLEPRGAAYDDGYGCYTRSSRSYRYWRKIEQRTRSYWTTSKYYPWTKAVGFYVGGQLKFSAGGSDNGLGVTVDPGGFTMTTERRVCAIWSRSTILKWKDKQRRTAFYRDSQRLYRSGWRKSPRVVKTLHAFKIVRIDYTSRKPLWTYYMLDTEREPFLAVANTDNLRGNYLTYPHDPRKYFR